MEMSVKLSKMRQHGERYRSMTWAHGSCVEGRRQGEPLPSCHGALRLWAGLPTQNLPHRPPALHRWLLTQGDGVRPGWTCAPHRALGSLAARWGPDFPAVMGTEPCCHTTHAMAGGFSWEAAGLLFRFCHFFASQEGFPFVPALIWSQLEPGFSSPGSMVAWGSSLPQLRCLGKHPKASS